MRKPIQIKGISTTSSYEDGDCLDMMNVRHEQGVLKPIEVFPIDFTLKNVYSLLYWHKNNDYTHLIGVRDGGIYWIKNEGAETETDELLLSVTGEVVLSHIGNLINVLDGEILKYIFWQDDKYFVISLDFDGTQTDTTLGPVKVDLKVDVSTTLRSYYGSYVLDDVDAVRNILLGLYQKSIGMESRDGRLNGFIMACTAIELYDGSFILQSQPVLLACASDLITRYSDLVVNGNTVNYIDNNLAFVIKDTDATENTTDDYFEYPSPEIKVSDAYLPAYATMQTSSYAPNAVLRYPIPNYSEPNPTKVFRSANDLKFKINSNINELYKSIVKSVSVFITQEVQIYKEELTNESLVVRDSSPGGFDWNFEFLKTKTNAEIIEELSENQQFYKVHEILFDDIKTTTENDGWVIIDLEGKLGENLLVQDELTTASFSNIKPKNQMTYNSMLHAWDIKNVLTRGWPMNYFYPNQGIGQFPSVVDTSINRLSGKFSFVDVSIKTDSETMEVVRYNTSITGVLNDLSPILSFPDSRATKMIFYRLFSAILTAHPLTFSYEWQKVEVTLTASDVGNYAYYISPDLKPISFNTVEISTPPYTSIPSESNQELNYQNKLKVSNTNNPFLFPDTQTYQIGDGSILNVASQSIRTSDGQFGQFPLICFCTDGVFSLEVGDGTVAYSTQVKPQSYERPISKAICTTPFGILFISNRGLCMVAGQDVIYLSEIMFEKFKNITLELPTAIESSFSFDTGLFNDYLKDCSAIVYNPKEQEVIMINPNKTFNYVYNFNTKQFYKNDELITNEIDNSLPSIQVWNGVTVKSVTTTNAGIRRIAFTTRPIKMQTTDFKRFERVILRGYLSTLTGAVACIWGSLDDRNFKLLRGITLTNGTTRKDLDFGMFGKTTYRSYIIGISMTVGTDSEIEAIEMEIEKLYNNTNMQ